MFTMKSMHVQQAANNSLSIVNLLLLLLISSFTAQNKNDSIKNNHFHICKKESLNETKV